MKENVNSCNQGERGHYNFWNQLNKLYYKMAILLVN